MTTPSALAPSAEVSPTASSRRWAKKLALAIDRVQPITDGIVVLAYHRIGARTPSPVDLPTDLFRRQLEYLAEQADILTIDEALRVLLHGQNAAGRRVLTFDDGTADFVDVVLPLLVEFDLPAMLYVSTGPIDNQKPYSGGAMPLSWNAVRECASTGLVGIGNHTHTHALLDRRPPLEVDLELDVCDERVGEEIGVRPSHFAYPKALPGSGYAAGAVRHRYRTAAVAGTRPNIPAATDPWHLQRSPIQVSDGWKGFVRKAAGGMRTEDDIRRFVNTVRYRGRMS